MKIACFDLETSSLKANFGVVLCGVVKPWGEKERIFRLDAFDPARRAGWADDSAVVCDLVAALSEPLVLVAHNGVNFDRKFLNARAVRWGLKGLNPRGRIIDPVMLARRHLAMSWNGLDSLSTFLGTEHRKTPVDGEVWLRAILNRDTTAMDAIVTHCVNDVLVLEEVAARLQEYVGRIQEWGSA